MSKVSGLYHISHLLSRRTASTHLRGLSWIMVCSGTMVGSWSDTFLGSWTQAHCRDYSLCFMAVMWESLALEGIWKTYCLKAVDAAWSLVDWNFSISSLCFKTRKWHRSSMAQPLFLPAEREGPHRARQGEKQGRAHKQAGRRVCSLPQTVPWRRRKEEFTQVVGFTTRIWTSRILQTGIWGC